MEILGECTGDVPVWRYAVIGVVIHGRVLIFHATQEGRERGVFFRRDGYALLTAKRFVKFCVDGERNRVDN